MKILLINSLYSPNIIGGAELSVKLLAEGIRLHGHDLVVVSLHAEKTRKCEIINGVRVYYLPLKNLYWPFNYSEIKSTPEKMIWHWADSYNRRMGLRISEIISLEHPDVVHTNNLSGFSVSVWDEVKKIGIPIVHTLRDYYLLCPRSTMYKDGNDCDQQCIECKILSEPKKRRTLNIDGLVGISKYILSKHLDAGLFTGVPNLRVIPNPHSGIVHERKNYSGYDDNINFGYLGRLSREKGIEVILDAVSQLPGTDFHLSIAGTGNDEYVKELRSKYQSPRIKFLGFVEPDRLLGETDVLIVPSLWNEPFGRSIVEAYSYGIPVIGSNRGGIPELIKDGVTGYIYCSEDINGLRSVLTRFLNKKGSLIRFKIAAMKESRMFQPEQISLEYLKIYKRVL